MVISIISDVLIMGFLSTISLEIMVFVKSPATSLDCFRWLSEVLTESSIKSRLNGLRTSVERDFTLWVVDKS